ncbi:MAG: hypothetical protein ACRDQ5_24190 [Sciscionella sp.]
MLENLAGHERWSTLAAQLRDHIWRSPPVPGPPSLRNLLSTVADAAEAIRRMLDEIKEHPLVESTDVERAAALRVDLDQAAAAAADLHHVLSAGVLPRLDSGAVIGLAAPPTDSDGGLTNSDHHRPGQTLTQQGTLVQHHRQ